MKEKLFQQKGTKLFKNKNTQTIKFHSRYPEFILNKPQPSTRYIPEWYRKFPGSVDGHPTLKKCVPFLDAIGSGYMIELNADIYWDKEKFIDNSNIKNVSEHFPQQSQDFPVPEGFNSQPYKWENQWHISTPKGYSTLFVHPLNTTTLPFYSVSGVVDTDKHPLITNFPFFIKSDFEGTIPAGTPIIQLIPFKRNDWESVVIDDKPLESVEREYEVMNPPYGWYKRNFWNRKLYS